jgi:hypothetical protein
MLQHNAMTACKGVDMKVSIFNMFPLEGVNGYLRATTALLRSSNWLGGRVLPRTGLYITAKRKITNIATNGVDWDPTNDKTECQTVAFGLLGGVVQEH